MEDNWVPTETQQLPCDDQSTRHTIIEYTNHQYKYGKTTYNSIGDFADFLLQEGKTLSFGKFSVVCKRPLVRRDSMDAFYDMPVNNAPVPLPKPSMTDRPALPLPQESSRPVPKPRPSLKTPTTPVSPTSPTCPHHSSCPNPEKHANVIQQLGMMMGQEIKGKSKPTMDSPDDVTEQTDDVTAAQIGNVMETQTDDVTKRLSSTSLGKEENVQDVLKAVVEGYLTKQGGKVKNWKYRWVSVSGTTMRYYKKKGDVAPLKVIDFQECTECAREYTLDQDFCFRLVMQPRTYYFYTVSEEECSKWLDMINKKMEIVKRNTLLAN